MIALLDPQQNETYVSAVAPSISLIRTGIETQGSCFFHALYMAFKSFRQLSVEEKKIYVEKQRKHLSQKISLQSWFSIQNGDVAFFQIIEMMRIMIYVIPSLLQDPKECTTLSSIYKIDTRILETLFNLLDPLQVDRQVLPHWDVECCKLEKQDVTLTKDIFVHRMKSKWHELYQKNIVQAIDELEKTLDPTIDRMTESQRLGVIHKLSDISYFLFDFVVEKAFSAFRQDIANYSTWINTFHYLYLIDSMEIDMNVIFIDATTGLPYEGMRYFSKPFLQQQENYIVLLYFPDYHFESIGEISNPSSSSSSGNGRKRIIHRIFSKDHPLIQSYFEYLATTRPVMRLPKAKDQDRELEGVVDIEEDQEDEQSTADKEKFAK